MTLDFAMHLRRQIAFSRATFGPDERTRGVAAHIKKELLEVESADDPTGRADEWVDVVILALDGLTRALAHSYFPAMNTDEIAAEATRRVVEKQNRNEARKWPDYRVSGSDAPIEHVRDDET